MAERIAEARRATLDFRIASPGGLDEAFIARWRHLSDTALEPNPYQDPRFIIPSFEHRADARQLRLAIVEAAGDLRAVMVFSIGSAFAGFPVRAVTTTGPFMTLVADMVCHPLVSAEHPTDTWECLLRGLRREGLPGLLELKNFPFDGTLIASLFEATRRMNLSVLTRDIGDRAFARNPGAAGLDSTEVDTATPSSAVTSLAHASRSGEKHRASERRHLEAEAGGPLLIADRGSDPSTSAAYLDLELAGWKGDPARGGRALRLTGNADWFTAVAAAFRADGRLAVEILTGGAETVHIGVNLRAGDGMFGFLDAYDERFARFGAGTLGRIAGVHHAFDRHDVSFFDPNIGTFYAEVTRQFADRRAHATLLVATGGPTARAIIGAVPLARRLRTRKRSAGVPGNGV